MAFTTKSGYVRVDIFKPSGKWYHTAAVDMSEHYRDDDIHNALYLACSEEHLKGLSGQWGLTTGPEASLKRAGCSCVWSPTTSTPTRSLSTASRACDAPRNVTPTAQALAA